MKNSCIYLTRQCPYHCFYCRLCNTKLRGPNLTATQWCEAQCILKSIGVDFNLFLGNETWLYGTELPIIVNYQSIPYAVYTSCQPDLFTKYASRFFDSIINQTIDNLSCGCDFPMGQYVDDDESKKAANAFNAFTATRLIFPHIDCQGTITISKRNIYAVPTIIRQLSDMGVDIGLNFIHGNTDGGFDFFPPLCELRNHTLRSEKDKKWLYHALKYRVGQHRVQNMEDTLELLEMDANTYVNNVGYQNTCWHCKGDPYGGPSVDADGSLRCCGYRRGTLTSQMSIFDLATEAGVSRWRESVEKDALACPGCTWSYPRLYARYKNRPDTGHSVFVNHAQVGVNGEVQRQNTREIQ